MPTFPILDIFEDSGMKCVVTSEIHRAPEHSLLIPTRMQSRRQMYEILGIGGNILPEESFFSSVTRHTTAQTRGRIFDLNPSTTIPAHLRRGLCYSILAREISL